MCSSDAFLTFQNNILSLIIFQIWCIKSSCTYIGIRSNRHRSTYQQNPDKKIKIRVSNTSEEEIIIRFGEICAVMHFHFQNVICATIVSQDIFELHAIKYAVYR